MLAARGLLILLAGVAACSSGGGAVSSGPAPSSAVLSSGHPGPAADWAMYGGNPARSNVSSAAAAIGSPAIAWHAHLDGAVYGQPLVIGGTVIVATEGDMVYALAAGTGQVRWQRHAGTPVPLSALPCGNIDPLGITSTPVYDRADGLVYAVAETAGYHHVLVGISVADGRVRVERDIPAPDGHPRYDQQRPGLLVMGGYVYVAFGGLYGDCGPYRGSVVAVPSSGRGAILSYVVPTAREGAIWGVSGPVLSGGDLYVSDGNGSVSATSFDGTDAVVALSPSLRRLDTFAPSSWKADSAGDADLGSTQPALIGSGRLLALGKSGTAYLLNTRHLGGVGGQIASLPVCSAYGGSAVSGPVVYEPCESGGLAAVSTAAGKLRVLWRGPASAQGSPVVAGGAVWVADYGGGTLYALSPSSGSVLATLPLGTSLPHFVSMSASGSYGFIGANDGVIAVSGV